MLHSELSFKETKILRYLHSNTSKSTRTTYSFQGQERDDEVKGAGNSYTTYFRQLDPRVGRWFSIDPKMTALESPYVSMGNNPITCIDIEGDTIEFVGMNKDEIENYKTTINLFKQSDLFKYYYESLETSQNVYYLKLDENLGKGGQFDPNNSTVRLSSLGRPVPIIQEWFHAYQKELGVYNFKDNSVKETEGDLMTEYVANELTIPFSGMILDQGNPGGWGEDILKINGKRDFNPTNEQVQSEKYDKLFNNAVNKRIEHFKTKGEEYKGYTSPNSNSDAKATKEVFKNIK